MNNNQKTPQRPRPDFEGQEKNLQTAAENNLDQPNPNVNPLLSTNACVAALTRISSVNPKILSKRYSLDQQGNLKKSTSAEMIQGKSEVVHISSLADLQQILRGLQPSQALAYGVPPSSSAGIVTRKRWLELGRPADPLPRTKDVFNWPNGPGVLLLDYDPDNDVQAMSRVKLVQAIRQAMPGLEQAAMLWWTSSSSHICNNGADLTGLKGQRLYILVENAQDIPRAGKALVEHLWAAGYGYYMASKAGSMLERCIVDASVWQSNRLDFAAGAWADPPLEQRRGEPVLIPGEVEILDTAEAIPDPDPEIQAQAKTNRDKAKAAVAGQANEQRKEYISSKALELAGADPDEQTLQQAEATVKRAVEHSILHGDFPVYVQDNGQIRQATVGEILDNRVQYQGLLTLDPLEPDYNGGRTVGKLYTVGSRPNLHSFAHGGRNFRLLRQPRRIELVEGRTYDAAVQTLEVLRQTPDVFDLGSALVLVENGKSYPLDEHSLRFLLGGLCQYYKTKLDKEENVYELLCDPPAKMCKEILALGERRELKPLEAAISAPTIRADGNLIQKPGYDPTSKLLLDLTEASHVPVQPTLEQCDQALSRLMHPFMEFPFCTELDWAVMLAGCLTAVSRPALPTAPGFGFDAPVQASGKTLLARSLSILATGEEPSVWPHTSGRDDEEIRKRLFSALREGSRAIVWDNVLGIFDSASLASAMTSARYRDRVLGKSESQTVPNKALFMLTGNNLCLAGDLPRRVLICRIDPNTSRPFAREFELDPAQYVQEHRLEMVEAALTLIRGALAYRTDPAPGRMASFEDWDYLVRQTVCWVDAQPFAGEMFGDVMDAVDLATSGDPEQEALHNLLAELYSQFGKAQVSSQEILQRMQVYDSLAECFRDLAGGETPKSTKSLGRLLRYRKDRIVGKFVLRMQIRANVKTWKIQKANNP